MLEAVRRRWRELQESRPGSRFADYYDAHCKSGGRRVLHLVGGGLVVAAGLVLMPAPGPGMVVVALGAGIVAQASRTAAVALDRLERVGWSLWRRGRGWWEGARPPARLAAAALGLLLVAGAAYGGYRVLLG